MPIGNSLVQTTSLTDHLKSPEMDQSLDGTPNTSSNSDPDCLIHIMCPQKQKHELNTPRSTRNCSTQGRERKE